MTASLRQSQCAFTFVEILAAMLFMGIVIPVAVKGLLLANTVGERATRKRTAGELADRVLNEALITETWRDGDQEGDFGEDFPGFHWRLTSEGWSEDTMRLVTVEITYAVQAHEFTERLGTLANELTDDAEVSQ